MFQVTNEDEVGLSTLFSSPMHLARREDGEDGGGRREKGGELETRKERKEGTERKRRKRRKIRKIRKRWRELLAMPRACFLLCDFLSNASRCTDFIEVEKGPIEACSAR